MRVAITPLFVTNSIHHLWDSNLRPVCQRLEFHTHTEIFISTLAFSPFLINTVHCPWNSKCPGKKVSTAGSHFVFQPTCYTWTTFTQGKSKLQGIYPKLIFPAKFQCSFGNAMGWSSLSPKRFKCSVSTNFSPYGLYVGQFNALYRPGVACPERSFVIHSLNNSLIICENIFKPYLSQIVGARDWRFQKNVHLPLHVTFQMSRITCQMLSVTCHRWYVICHT